MWAGGRTDGWADGWTDGRMDGRKGRMDGRTDGRSDVSIHMVYACVHTMSVHYPHNKACGHWCTARCRTGPTAVWLSGGVASCLGGARLQEGSSGRNLAGEQSAASAFAQRSMSYVRALDSLLLGSLRERERGRERYVHDMLQIVIRYKHTSLSLSIYIYI